MGDFLITLMMLMIPLGFIQVVSALVAVIFTRNKLIREHFAYYLLGVAGYFATLYPLVVFTEFIPRGFGQFYFFAGALGLAFFHISIFFRDVRHGRHDFQPPRAYYT